MFSKPTSRMENEHVTREFAKKLAEHCITLGASRSLVTPSGNASEDDDAFVFEATIDGLTFNVEVFGPYWQEQD